MTNRAIDVLSTVDRKEVQAIGKAINDAFMVANNHAQEAIKSYLEVGMLLKDARQFFKGDKEYGQWRAENTTLSQSWANKLIRVHDTYGDKPPAGLPISTLAEMTNVSEAKRKELEEQAADPEQKNPSVRDVKKEAAKEKQEEQMPLAMKERLAKEKAAEKKLTKTLEESAQDAIDLPVHERISIWNGIEPKDRTETDAFILMGLPCYFDGAPNIDTIIVLTSAMREEYQTPEFDEAYTIIKEWMK